MKFICSIAVVVTILITGSHARSDTSLTDKMLNAFAMTCLSNMGHPEKLRASLESGQRMALPQMPPELAKRFLGKKTGVVWALPKILGEAVLVSHDDGSCTIFSRRWSESNFSGKLEELFAKKIEFFRLKEVRRNEGVLSTITYNLLRHGAYKKALESKGLKTDPINFIVLSTSEKDNAAYQLALTLSGAKLPK